MRKPILALLAAGGLAILGTAPAGAVGTRYPFCMQGNDAPGLSDCSYTSYHRFGAVSLLHRESLLQPRRRLRSARLSRPRSRPIHLSGSVSLKPARRLNCSQRARHSSRANVN